MEFHEVNAYDEKNTYVSLVVIHIDIASGHNSTPPKRRRGADDVDRSNEDSSSSDGHGDIDNITAPLFGGEEDVADAAGASNWTHGTMTPVPNRSVTSTRNAGALAPSPPEYDPPLLHWLRSMSQSTSVRLW